MKTLADQMSVYASYHRNTWNKLTHFIGIPSIVFSILIPMSWLRVSAGGLEITAAMGFVLAVLVYYYFLDVLLALAMTVFIGAILYAADRVAQAPVSEGWVWFGIFFAGGWIFQLAGHGIEGKRPALVDNLFQVFVAPIFLMAEVFFALGLKKNLKEQLEQK